MIFNGRKWRERIPLYLAGRLADDERRAFEKALGESPRLRRELEAFAEIRDLYAGYQRQAAPPSDRVFRRVEAAIGAYAKAPAPKPAVRPGGWLRRTAAGLFAAPRLSWALVAIQLVVIVLLLAGRTQTPVFKTLTATSRAVHQAAAVQVVFQPHATETQIRALLLGMGASIVDGPTAEGLYTLRLGRKTTLAQALEKLRRSPLVHFAAKVY